MEKWLLLTVLLVGTIGAVVLANRSEKRRALRHMNGRDPLTPPQFALRFFEGREAAVAEKLLPVLERHLPFDLTRLHPDDLLVEDLRMDALDSLSTVEFVLDIEEKLGVKIPEDVAEKLFTFRQVVEHLARSTRDTQQCASEGRANDAPLS